MAATTATTNASFSLKDFLSSFMLVELFKGLAITIDSEPRADGSSRTTSYDIDLFKCLYCGFCEESCPVDSIVETHIHEYHFEKRGENIVTKHQLLAIGDRFEEEVAQRRAADAAFR